jgi:predicted nucleic acid-binding protein
MQQDPMQIVIDTSAILAVVLEEPQRPGLLAATEGAVLIAPASLPWEVGNGLVALVRRRRLTAAEAVVAWTAYEAIPRRLVEVDVGEAIHLAVEFKLYAYDAYFLVLARRRRLPLLTLDRPLREAARQAGVDLVEIEE